KRAHSSKRTQKDWGIDLPSHWRFLMFWGNNFTVTERSAKEINGSECLSAFKTLEQPSLLDLDTAWAIYGHVDAMVNNLAPVEIGISQYEKIFLSAEANSPIYNPTVCQVGQYCPKLVSKVAKFGLRAPILAFGHFHTYILHSRNLQSPAKLSARLQRDHPDDPDIY
ncbi:hypothetical protein N7462_007299, partial [Penicillium macrosclerotiorum]|uniref:uncharacterized protein n=1 Tax=Penicillium macrosclerotiorum TaxID=303699 RepID=UPI002546E228